MDFIHILDLKLHEDYMFGESKENLDNMIILIQISPTEIVLLICPKTRSRIGKTIGKEGLSKYYHVINDIFE
jgi:hypothetical protein